MSTIIMHTFAVYKCNGEDIRILAGASDARIAKDGRVELLAGNVPFNSSRFAKRTPRVGEGLLMLYGQRDQAQDLQRWRAFASAMQAEFVSAEVEVDVGVIVVNLVSSSMLRSANGSCRFLNVRRMRADLQREVLTRFARYVELVGGSSELEMSRVSQIADRPDLFARLVKDDAAMGQLDVLVIPVADCGEAEPRMRQLAFVRPKARVVSVRQGSTEGSIVLPMWMNSNPGAIAT